METTVPILIGLVAALLLALGALVDDRRTRARQRARREPAEPPLPLLHSINDDRCIGCEACIDVCQTEVLDLISHKVRVSRFSDCVQCEQCANACPTQALVMYRQGTTPRMLTVPEIDDQLQTGVPGQYLIGEVAGKPLVKNAANLGRAVIEHIARGLAPRTPGAGADSGDGILDVAIVGSGPGGLSAGLACVKHRLSCVVLEKEHVLASTVSRYPKGKHFMAEPCTSQNVSYLPVFDGSKEQLVAAWRQVVDGVGLPIKLGEAVETVQRGDDGVFTIKSTVASYRARAVVLATGLRGKPRLLAVPGANLEKVHSLLDDPAEFAGQDVLVVGGGDSAVEGAIALADAGARVTLSCRIDGFKRCKQGNQKRLAEMIAGKRLAVVLESNIVCFTPGDVTIAVADKSETTIANQHAFVLIGAETPVAWLEANHVRFVERPHLYALGSSEDAVRRFAPDAAPCPHSADEALAILLDRPVSSTRRVQSVVEHLRDELREVVGEVVTSVSAMFRLSELAPGARRAATQAPAPGAGSKVIPASRLIARRAVTAPPPEAASATSDAVRAVPAVPPAPEPALEPAPLRPRSPQRRAHTTGAVRRPPPRLKEQTTLEIASLPALEQQALEALRHGPEQTTVEIASLPALEQQAFATLLRPDDEPAPTSTARPPVVPAHVTTAPPQGEHDATLEISSLRALDRSTEGAPADPRELATDIDMRSLREIERVSGDGRSSLGRDALAALGIATEIDLPSLRALDRARDPRNPPPRFVKRDGHAVPRALAADARRPAPPPAIATAAPPAVPSRITEASAISRPTAAPPAVPSRITESSATSRPTAIPPLVPSRTTESSATSRPIAVPPPVPARAGTGTPSTRSRPATAQVALPPRASVPTPPTLRALRIAHGSHSFATHRAPDAAPAPQPAGAGGSAAPDARATHSGIHPVVDKRSLP